MNYEKAEKRLSDMSEKDVLSDNDYGFLAEIAQGDDMCLKCNAADLLINHTTKQAVEILKILSRDNDATVRVSAYDNMWVFEKQDFDEILRNAVANEKEGTARSYAICSLYDLYSENSCDAAELIAFMHKLYLTEKDRRCKLEDKDYRMRITAVNTFSEMLNKENKEVLLSVAKKRLKAEKSGAVKASLEKFVSDAEYM